MTNQAQGKPWDGHTPLPWQWTGDFRLLHNEPASYSQTVLMIHDETWRPTEADRALIVERVNKGPAADAMAEALEKAASDLLTAAHDLDALGEDGLSHFYKVKAAHARQALADYRESVS